MTERQCWAELGGWRKFPNSLQIALFKSYSHIQLFQLTSGKGLPLVIGRLCPLAAFLPKDLLQPSSITSVFNSHYWALDIFNKFSQHINLEIHWSMKISCVMVSLFVHSLIHSNTFSTPQISSILLGIDWTQTPSCPLVPVSKGMVVGTDRNCKMIIYVTV